MCCFVCLSVVVCACGWLVAVCGWIAIHKDLQFITAIFALRNDVRAALRGRKCAPVGLQMSQNEPLEGL